MAHAIDSDLAHEFSRAFGRVRVHTSAQDADIASVLRDRITEYADWVPYDVGPVYRSIAGDAAPIEHVLRRDFDILCATAPELEALSNRIHFVEFDDAVPRAVAFRASEGRSVIGFSSGLTPLLHSFLSKLEILRRPSQKYDLHEKYDAQVIGATAYEANAVMRALVRDLAGACSGRHAPAALDPPFLHSPFDLCERVTWTRRFLLVRQLLEVLDPPPEVTSEVKRWATKWFFDAIASHRQVSAMLVAERLAGVIEPNVGDWHADSVPQQLTRLAARDRRAVALMLAAFGGPVVDDTARYELGNAIVAPLLASTLGELVSGMAPAGSPVWDRGSSAGRAGYALARLRRHWVDDRSRDHAGAIDRGLRDKVDATCALLDCLFEVNLFARSFRKAVDDGPDPKTLQAALGNYHARVGKAVEARHRAGYYGSALRLITQ